MHRGYVRRRLADGVPGTDPSLSDWESLPKSLRESNLDQALDIEHKVAAIGCELVPDSKADHALLQFTDSEVETLAEIEHERWLNERRAGGWTPATVKDVPLKRSPYLVPWAELDEPAREIDREVVRALPRLLADAGFAIRRKPA